MLSETKKKTERKREEEVERAGKLTHLVDAEMTKSTESSIHS